MMRCRWCCVVALLCLSSCYESEAGDELESAYLRARCERTLRCHEYPLSALGGLSSLGTDLSLHFAGDLDTCLEVSGASGPQLGHIEFYVDEGYAVFNDAAFSAYLDELRNGSCAVFPMADYLQGLLPLGSECLKGAQCDSGYCDGCPGVCVEPPQVGDPCPEDLFFSCGYSLFCHEGRCTDPAESAAAEGESCVLISGLLGLAYPTCDEGLYCNSRLGVCQLYVQEGEELTEGELCDPGLFVGDDSLCHAPQVVSNQGDVCEPSMFLCDWSLGLTCQYEVGTGVGACLPAPTEGQLCQDEMSYQRCDPRVPLYCDDDGSCQRLGEVGEPCEASSECLSRTCNTGAGTCSDRDYLSCGEAASGGG